MISVLLVIFIQNLALNNSDKKQRFALNPHTAPLRLYDRFIIIIIKLGGIM